MNTCESSLGLEDGKGGSIWEVEVCGGDGLRGVAAVEGEAVGEEEEEEAVEAVDGEERR